MPCPPLTSRSGSRRVHSSPLAPLGGYLGSVVTPEGLPTALLQDRRECAPKWQPAGSTLFVRTAFMS